jgi:hypothetical protein
MNDTITFARQGTSYGTLRKAWIHWGHFSALRLLSGLCEANGLDAHAKIFERAETALQSSAACLTQCCMDTSRAKYARKKANPRGRAGFDDDLASALSKAHETTGLGVGALSKLLDGDWFRGIHEFAHLHFPEIQGPEARAHYDTRRTLGSAHLASLGVIELRSLMPSIRKALSAMRKAPLDWGAEAEVAMAMAGRLPKLAAKQPRIGAEPVEFLNNIDIASGVHTPYFSIILPLQSGELLAASAAHEPFASDRLTTKDLADAIRFQTLEEAIAHADKLGTPSHAIVEITLAARGARLAGFAQKAPTDLNVLLEEAQMVVKAADSRYEKYAIDHALTQTADFETAFSGMSTTFCAAAHRIGLYAPDNSTYYTPSKAYLGRDDRQLLSKLSHAHKGILVDYAIASARIAKAQGLPESSTLNGLLAPPKLDNIQSLGTRNASRL